MYRRILKDKYDIDVTELALVVLHPDHPNKNYEVIKVNIMDAEINALWKLRESQVIWFLNVNILYNGWNKRNKKDKKFWYGLHDNQQKL